MNLKKTCIITILFVQIFETINLSEMFGVIRLLSMTVYYTSFYKIHRQLLLGRNHYLVLLDYIKSDVVRTLPRDLIVA